MTDYNRIVREGLWVHKTKEKSPCLEVIGCDYHRKTVTIVGGEQMDMEALVKDYMIPSLEGMDLGRLEKESLLGGLDKEGNQPRNFEDEPFVDTVDEVLKQAPQYIQETIPQTSQIINTNKVVELTSEQRMLRDALNISKGNKTTIETDVKIEFDFDVNKIIQLSKMFEIDSDKVVDIILSTDDGIEILKDVLRGVVRKISE